MENDSKQLGDLHIDRHSDSLKNSQLTLSPRMLKKGDDNHDEVDDRSKNHYALTELLDSNADCLRIFLQDSVFTALLSY